MEKICWIDVVDYQQADKALQGIYDQVKSPDGHLDNLYQGFSLRPQTIKPADDLYLAALHHENNTLPKWFSELIGTYVAILSGCEYARTHHGHNFVHLFGETKGNAVSDSNPVGDTTSNAERAEAILAALEADQLELCGEAREVSVLRYVKKLCLKPEAITEGDVAELSRQQWSDGEILEIVQIVAMFSYFVRVINGVGISLVGDKVGLY